MLARSVDLQPAWVLHTRPYKESSLLVDLLTWDHGRISVVANGARGSATKKGKPRRGQLLQPFAELLVSWTGKTELKTLKALEQQRVHALMGARLFSGLYANELLQRLMQPWQSVDGVPELYQWLLEHLAGDASLESVLRLFEKQLLDCLGYGLPLGCDVGSGADMCADNYYRYDPENGFWRLSGSDSASVPNRFSGKALMELAVGQVSEASLPELKRLMRMAIHPLLGERVLRSRELFRAP
ncbi:DNA repair protein RecO [Parendozoicomonas sp. Alg238-R29]|uniref:DNA repair protein RecO n=1 Tax=Parendozoicomonas sp. Alg238-R29 TaxID=2993446 RepID=UPI00248E323A|nr:DNA repair protein RecO [Parendozoicomonas sp. Alg238-R29]